MKHPIQPIEDDNGTLRFKPNKIVQYLLDAGPFDMNHLAVIPFPQEDREQFAQLIGYSLTGFSELSYVRDETYETAATMYKAGLCEKDARISHLTEVIEKVASGLKEIVPAVFRIHPDDLER